MGKLVQQGIHSFKFFMAYKVGAVLLGFACPSAAGFGGCEQLRVVVLDRVTSCVFIRLTQL